MFVLFLMPVSVLELLRRAKAAYPDEMLDVYFDMLTGLETGNGDDGLALFVGREIRSVHDTDLSTEQNAEMVHDALLTAAQELEHIATQVYNRFSAVPRPKTSEECAQCIATNLIRLAAFMAESSESNGAPQNHQPVLEAFLVMALNQLATNPEPSFGCDPSVIVAPWAWSPIMDPQDLNKEFPVNELTDHMTDISQELLAKVRAFRLTPAPATLETVLRAAQTEFPDPDEDTAIYGGRVLIGSNE